MNIGTTDDLADQVADWLGIYGGSKESTGASNCVCTQDGFFCCRVAFMSQFPDRIRQAVENEIKINSLDL
jgi:hypothetical protein